MVKEQVQGGIYAVGDHDHDDPESEACQAAEKDCG